MKQGTWKARPGVQSGELVGSRFHYLHNPPPGWSPTQAPVPVPGRVQLTTEGMHSVVQKAEPGRAWPGLCSWSRQGCAWELLGWCIRLAVGALRPPARVQANGDARMNEGGRWSLGSHCPTHCLHLFLLLGALLRPNALTRCSSSRGWSRLSGERVCYVDCLWQVQELSCTGKRRADERHPSVLCDSHPPSKATSPSPLTLSCLSPSPTGLGVSSPFPQWLQDWGQGERPQAG